MQWYNKEERVTSGTSALEVYGVHQEDTAEHKARGIKIDTAAAVGVLPLKNKANIPVWRFFVNGKQ